MIAEELPEARAYTLDVALNPVTGQAVAVELNGLLNAGLYATRTDALFQALSAGSAFPRWNSETPQPGRC